MRSGTLTSSLGRAVCTSIIVLSAACTVFDGLTDPDAAAQDAARRDAAAPDGSRRDSGPPGDAHDASPDGSSMGSDAGCDGPNLFAGQGRCYRFVADAETWVTAESACEDWGGGHLAVLASDASYDYVSKEVINAETPTNPVWIGLQRSKPTAPWTWVDDAGALVKAYWAPGEPMNDGQDCVVEASGSPTTGNLWHNYVCSLREPYVCERALP